jgi:hypothetical protein
VLESGGISFAVARHHLHLVSGVTVEVEDFMGREGIVVHHPFAGGC